jgi:glycine betaine/proline transport system substrate-binding protein
MPILHSAVRSRFIAILAAALMIGGSVVPSIAQTKDVVDLPLGDQTKLKIGYDTFSDTEAINVVAQQMLEKLGYSVEVQSLEPGVLYAGVASGQVDIYSGGNLPNNHKDYWDKFGANIHMLGPLHNGLRIGMATPAYVDINSIAELKGREKEFDNKVLGNTPGAGNMRQTANAIKVYGLDMELVESSEAAVSAVIDRAITAKQPIVFAAWSPNWWWGKWQLKWLDDPLSGYGPADGVWHLARKGLETSAPRAFAFYQNYKMSPEQQGAIMLEVVNGTKAEEAAKKFIEANPDLVKAWLGQ